MPKLMRCLFCGLLQDEPAGVKSCARCGGELAFETSQPQPGSSSYLQVQMELDQVKCPSGRNFDRYLLVTIRSPRQVPPEQAALTQSGRLPLSFVAVLDSSGSMQGEKLLQAKEAVRRASMHLQDGDIFSLVTFESKVHCVFEPAAVNDHTRQVIQSALGEITATGMTALCGGLEMGIQKAKGAKKDSTLILLLSDGQANVGETDLERVGQRGAEAREKGITVSAIGVGLDYNEALMVEIANQGGGRFYHLSDAGQIPAYLTGELGEMAQLAARNVQIQLTLPSGGTVFPLSAASPARQNGEQATIQVGDLPCDTELEIPIRLTLPAQPAGMRLSVEGQVSHLSPRGNNLTASLNRVTVRCVEEKAFALREGVVLPVVETVYKHMKAAYVVNISRASAYRNEKSEHLVKESAAGLQSYAALLGEERAKEENLQIQQQAEQMKNPAAAKQNVYAANIIYRSSKKHG